VAVARRGDRLASLTKALASEYGVEAVPLVSDLADPAAPAALHAEIERRGISIDFLVNNAGFSLYGRFLDHPWEDHARMIQVMATSPSDLTYRLLGGMVERGYGRIVQVASPAAYFPGSPRATLYSCVKALVVRLSETIAAEYAEDGIHSTASLPGYTETEIFDGTPWKESMASGPTRWMRLEPMQVAREAYDACMAGRRVVIHGRFARWLTGLMQRGPYGLAARVAASFSPD
jgi:short-subunit dehydrogenase